MPTVADALLKQRVNTDAYLCREYCDRQLILRDVCLKPLHPFTLIRYLPTMWFHIAAHRRQ